MLEAKTLQSEKGLRELIARNLRKEIHPGTKPSIDFIEKILDDDAFAAACIAKGLARAREFQWATTADLVCGVYRAAVEHRRCASV